MSAKPWFKPKRFGYGATPTCWQGWALTAAFGALIVLSATLLQGALRWVGPLVLGVIFAGVANQMSSGAWRWRWGKR